MIFPVSMNRYSPVNQIANEKKEKVSAKFSNSFSNNMHLSGYNSPIRSYISFGYCERNGGHYQKMYEIDEKFSTKIQEKIQDLEKLKDQIHARYSLEDESNIEAAKIMMQYSNMQTVFAEMPPAYTIVTGTKLKEAMEKTKTFTNPIDNLITINNITKIKGVNKDLPNTRTGKATRAAQLYSTLILLEQIKANKNKPEYQETQSEINALIAMVEKTIKGIYGEDIFERVDKLGKMGRKVSLDNQKMALNFLIEIDCVSKELKMPSEFEERLAQLAQRQSDIEGRTGSSLKSQKSPLMAIKVFYPDHEHTMDHLTGTPHTHEHHEHIHEHFHEHLHEHTEDESYEELLDKAKSKKSLEQQTVQVEEKKKHIHKGE